MERDNLEALHYQTSQGEYPRVHSLIGKNIVELLVKSGADIDCSNNVGWTALHHASISGSVEIVRCLVNNGAALNVIRSDGKTPLMMAAEFGKSEVVELLVKSGADIDCSDNVGWTALHHASISGSVEIVRCLVNNGAALNVKRSDGKTPLMMAAEFGKSEVVELLVNSGADITCSDNRGWTTLHCASFLGLVEIVQCLLNKGAAPNVKTADGRTPLMVASKSLERIFVELCIDSEDDIHCANNDGRRVLRYSSYDGSVKIVRCFGKAAVLNIEVSREETSYLMTAEVRKREVVELLVNSGADIACSDNGRWTALHCASFGGSVEIVQYLLNKGAAPNEKTADGTTPLMVAAKSSEREVVEHLINSGAEIDCCDNSGDTALHLAVKCDKIGIADYLLKTGADCNLEDNNGDSSFRCLIRKEIPDVNTIKVCIEKGAYVKSADYNILLAKPLLKEVILQDVKLCLQAVINKFNNKDLPLLYRGLSSAQELPRIEKMKIGNESGMAREVEQSVACEIQAKGFCNVFQMVPLVLGILCVKSAIERPCFKQASCSEKQNGLKRLGYCNKQEYPCKKVCNL